MAGGNGDDPAAPAREQTLTADHAGVEAATVPGRSASGRAGPQPGQRWARYQVLEPLGEGGMGSVHAAHDGDLDRTVALKVLHDEHLGRASQERLRREARAMARVAHPNVVPVYDVGEHDGRTYYTMERVRGQSVKEWLREARPWREVQRVFLDAARGLAAIHAAGLVHRDVKPGNLLLGDDGRARVADLGIALGDPAVPGGAALGATTTLHNAGTPAYMAPEQLRGEAGDARADQYAFGVALFEALHGQRPYAGTSILERLKAIEAAPVAVRDVPAWLDALVRRTLAVEPAARFADMADVIAALAGPAPRRRVWQWLIFVGVIGLTAATVYYDDSPPPLKPRRARAPDLAGAAVSAVPDPAPAAAHRVTATSIDACVWQPVFVGAEVVTFDAGALRADRLYRAALPDGPATQVVPVLGAGLELLHELHGRAARAGLGAGSRMGYRGDARGLVREDRVTHAETILVPDPAISGVAVSPDSTALVYTTCHARREVVDVAAVPPRRLIDSDQASQGAFGPHGELAWTLREHDVELLHVRLPDGRQLQLTRPALGSIVAPSFSSRGDRVVFAVPEGPAPGLYVVDVMAGADPVQLTSDGGDTRPRFLPDDRIAFTARGDGARGAAVVLDPDSGARRRIRPGARVVGIDPRTGAILLHGERLTWIDPATGRERPGPADLPAHGSLFQLSPGARWLSVHSGDDGREVWRVPLAPPGPPQRVYTSTLPLFSSAIDDDGRVAVTVEKFTGDLYVVEAAPGTRF